MSLTFALNDPRDALAKARRELAALQAAVASQDRTRIADSLYNFSVSAYHVKDWLSAGPSPACSKADAEAFVQATPALLACRDVCNASKHRRITRYVPEASAVTTSAPGLTLTSADPALAGPQPRFRVKVIMADGRRLEVLAHDCPSPAGQRLPVGGPALAKGEGVALWMEGTISSVQADGEAIYLLLTGRFWFEQYRGATRSIVEVDGQRGLPVTVTQAHPFFAMTTDWRGGAIRDAGALLGILRAAAQAKRSVRFELLDAQLTFGRDDSFTVVSAHVVRATDHDLR